MNEDDNLNIDDDPNISELDFSKLSSLKIGANEENPFFFIPIKSNLPKHIDDVLEKELSLLMNSIALFCLKDTGFEDIKPIFNENIKISLIGEIKKNLIYLKDLNKKKQKLAVKSIIENYLYDVHFVIALATGNKEKISQLLKYDRRKYDENDFIKAQELKNKEQIYYDDALLEVYEQNPNTSPELKDKNSLEFYNASISFRQWRSRKNK